jgi:ferredoxin-NADP reductase
VTNHVRFIQQQHEAENATSFLFEPDVAISYQAGQYLRYTLPHPDADNRGITRSFTIASFPAEPTIRITTRLITPSSSFKHALARLEPGSALQLSGPFGRFVYTETHQPAVFIAGGIGITPFRSIIGDLASRKIHSSIVLLYSNRTSDIPFQAFFDALAPHWPELRLVYTVTQPDPDWRGQTCRIDGAFINQHVSNLVEPVFFVSGPTALVEAMRITLSDIGVDPSHIKHEAFPGYDRRAGADGGPHVPSFARDIRPLFRDKDVDEMRFAFDLSAYDDVKNNASGIYDRLVDGSMPCDRQWSAERIALFRQWMDESYPV